MSPWRLEARAGLGGVCPRASAEPGCRAWNEAVGVEPEASKAPEAGGRKCMLCRRLGCGQRHGWISHPPL